MRNRGFTLVELMVTVAIVAILAAIAFPNFEGSMRSNRLATTTNELIASLSLARSEAIRNASGSFVCASTDGTTCSGEDDWSAGWLVGRETDAAGEFEVVRFSQPQSKMLVSGPDDRLEFDGRGRAVAVSGLSLRPTECGDRPLEREVSVRMTGQVAKGELKSCE